MIKLKNPIIATGTDIDIPEFLNDYYLSVTEQREFESVCTVYDTEKQFVGSGCIYSNISIETNTAEIVEETYIEVENLD